MREAVEPILSIIALAAAVLALGIGLLALAVALFAAEQRPGPLSPLAGVLLAWTDARGLPTDLAPYVRYLWRWQEPEAKLVEWTQAINGHVQALSTGLRTVPPYEVPGSGGRLLRVDLRDYHWDPDLWEKLAGADPYFHVRLDSGNNHPHAHDVTKPRVTITGGGNDYGRAARIVVIVRADAVVILNGQPTHLTGRRRNFETPELARPGEYDVTADRLSVTVTVHPGDRVEIDFTVVPADAAAKVALAPWLVETPDGQAAVAGLVAATHSQIPIVSGEWFVNQTAINFNRQAGYYSWLNIKDRDTFNALVGFDPKTVARGKRKELLEAVARSRVSKRPRRISAFPALGANAWYTFDNVDALDKTNPLRVLDDDNFQHAAEEAFGPLPNGWIAWGLFVGPNPADKALKDGQTQDSAPDFIGYSHGATDNDGKIHVGLSCWQCHCNEGDGGKSGIMDVKEWARTLYQPPFGLQSYSPDVARDLADKYLRDLQGPINDDRQRFGRVIVQTTGMQPAKWARTYGDYWAAYESKGIDLATVEIDLGIPRAVFLPGWEKVAATGNLDPVVAALLAAAKRGDRGPIVERQQWDEVYGLAQYAARGYVTPPSSN